MCSSAELLGEYTPPPTTSAFGPSGPDYLGIQYYVPTGRVYKYREDNPGVAHINNPTGRLPNHWDADNKQLSLHLPPRLTSTLGGNSGQHWVCNPIGVGRLRFWRPPPPTPKRAEPLAKFHFPPPGIYPLTGWALPCSENPPPRHDLSQGGEPLNKLWLQGEGEGTIQDSRITKDGSTPGLQENGRGEAWSVVTPPPPTFSCPIGGNP